MRNGIIPFLTIFLLISTNLESEIIFNEAKTIQINLGINYSTSGSLYNIDGNQKANYIDTIPSRNQPSPDSIKLDEIRGFFEYRRYNLNLGVNYSITNNIFCFLQIPISYYTLKDQYEPTLNSTGTKLDLYSPVSVTQFDQFLIGGRYRIDSAKISPILSLAVSLPQSFKNGLQYSQRTYTNSYNTYNGIDKDSFKIYNSYQFFLSGAGHLQFEKSWVEAEATLAIRTGEFSHEFIGRLEGGFSTVPKTSLRGFIIWTQSLSSFDKAQKVYQQYTTFQENCLDAGAGFNAILMNRISVDISYRLRLGLKNTLAWSTFMLTGGYRL